MRVVCVYVMVDVVYGYCYQVVGIVLIELLDQKVLVFLYQCVDVGCSKILFFVQLGFVFVVDGKVQCVGCVGCFWCGWLLILCELQ